MQQKATRWKRSAKLRRDPSKEKAVEAQNMIKAQQTTENCQRESIKHRLVISLQFRVKASGTGLNVTKISMWTEITGVCVYCIRERRWDVLTVRGEKKEKEEFQTISLIHFTVMHTFVSKGLNKWLNREQDAEREVFSYLSKCQCSTYKPGCSRHHCFHFSSFHLGRNCFHSYSALQSLTSPVSLS